MTNRNNNVPLYGHGQLDTREAIALALTRARLHSPFLSAQLLRFPRIEELLSAGDLGGALSSAHAAGDECGTVASKLRRRRSAVALALGIGDLGCVLSLEQSVAALSDLADRTLDEAVTQAIRERTPDAPPLGFTVLALGKHGSRELNYSSDLDCIFLFDPMILPRKEREEPGQAAVRIGQRVVELIQKRDAEGYAFRIDLRLRPSPEVTPIALPVDAAISYYESSALAWERAAFIRARIVAGDHNLGRYFLDAIHPFVWRRSLGFGTVEEMQAMTRRIRDHYAQGQGFGPGYDLKRGLGGIREVEFFAQIHQLIHGGRDASLRAPATLDALAALSRAGVITREDEGIMSDAYRVLRTIEHRLQMVDDRQTHTLPANIPDLDNVAQLHGLADGQALLDLLRPHVEDVAARYGDLGGDVSEPALPNDGTALDAYLADAGFADPPVARARIESWRSGSARSLRTPAARNAFEAMLPGLVQAFGRSPDPMLPMNRFDDLVNGLPGGVNFYNLLQARPGLASMLATLLAYAPTLAEDLGRRPELLDGLIDASAFAPVPPVSELVREFDRGERSSPDYQDKLDQARWQVNERRFALGAQIISGRSDPLDVAAGYARVAEAAIEVLARAAIDEFSKRHGRVPESELVILGLGRLGGEALTHASDLDIVYLFTGTHEAMSDGDKPLRAADYYNRLAQRVTAALSVPTAAGPLYPVDTRLRPSGVKGLLAVSLESFAEYQHKQAWTWEHMALTRARPVFGSEPARRVTRDVIADVLHGQHDPVVKDAARMRRDMAEHKPPSGAFDVKLGEGGLVDLEFAIHVLQLRHKTAFHPNLADALRALIASGFAPPDLEESYQLLSRLLVTLRLVCQRGTDPAPSAESLVAQVCGFSSWDDLLAAHRSARQSILNFWRSVAGNDEE